MKIFFKELIITFALSMIFMFILSLIIAQTMVSETIMIPGIITISTIVIMIRCNKSGKSEKAKRNNKWSSFWC